MLKIIASKCIHNFAPHLTYVATLPRITLATERHVVFLLVGDSENEVTN